jgi:16S rRNA (uracil1498-N3)-methyltransferase
MSDRFYSPRPITGNMVTSDNVTGDKVTLDGQEAHHLLHVMRAKVGARVTLFDGSGAEFAAEIVRCGRSEVETRILERREVNRELAFELVVGVSLPKGDRQKWLVEKLTELGVTELVPLQTERGVAQPTDSTLERLERGGVEAAKQCGRNRLLRLAKPQAWNTWLTSGMGTIVGDLRSPECRRYVAHPNGIPLMSPDLATPLPTRIAVGPEGGFTDDEVAAAIAAGWQSVDLGPRILRVETAAVALAAAISLR